MKKIVHLLVAAAGSRAKNVLRKQAEAVKPSKIDYRLNAGGWN